MIQIMKLTFHRNSSGFFAISINDGFMLNIELMTIALYIFRCRAPFNWCALFMFMFMFGFTGKQANEVTYNIY